MIEQRDHYLVIGKVMRNNGKPQMPFFIRQWILANYQVAAQFGSTATPRMPGYFRGNAQTIYILKRKPRLETEARRPAKSKRKVCNG
jgi:hypothetical protein